MFLPQTVDNLNLVDISKYHKTCFAVSLRETSHSFIIFSCSDVRDMSGSFYFSTVIISACWLELVSLSNHQSIQVTVSSRSDFFLVFINLSMWWFMNYLCFHFTLLHFVFDISTSAKCKMFALALWIHLLSLPLSASSFLWMENCAMRRKWMNGREQRIDEWEDMEATSHYVSAVHQGNCLWLILSGLGGGEMWRGEREKGRGRRRRRQRGRWWGKEKGGV